MHRFKRLMAVGVMALSMLSLTGCGAKLQDFATQTVSETITTRLRENKEIVGILKANELIDNSTYTSIIKNIEAQEKKYNESAEITTVMCKSISRIWTFEGNWAEVNDAVTGKGNKKADEITLTDDEGDLGQFKASKMVDLILSDYLQEHYTDWGAEKAGWQERTGGAETTEPIKIIDLNEHKSMFDEALDFEIYVLKPEIKTTDSTGGTDGVYECIKASINDSGRLTNLANLKNYFEPAVNINGETLKLSDLVNINDLVCTSTDNYDSANNEPGKDLVIPQEGHDILAFRLQEFNQKSVDEFFDIIGIDATTGEGTNKWLYYLSGENNGDTNKVFLVEYPVYYISGIKDIKDNTDSSELILKESDMSVNLYTGKVLVNVETNTGAKVQALVTNKDGESYISASGAANYTDDSQSAFIISGATTYNVSGDFNNNAKNVDVVTGRVILRDYLELTYAPGFDVTDNNSLVVFGRKIRFKNIKTKQVRFISGLQSLSNGDLVVEDDKPINTILYLDKNKACAEFVDKSGNKLGTTELRVEELCDISELLKGNVKKPTGAGEIASKGEASAEDSKSTNSLTWESTGELLGITTKFPSDIIGKTDFINTKNVLSKAYTNEDQTIHQTFYVVATTHDVFSTNLFSTWINSKDTESSLAWWNNWLNKNDYIYKIDVTNLEGYLAENFKFELSQNGIIILDLDIVMKIQEEFDKDAEAKAHRTVRTVARLLGVFMMFYSVILGLAYVADTVASLGVKFLEKLTFGHWVAVKYDTDIPTHDAEGQQYLTFGMLASRLVVLIGVVALITTVDILYLVIILMKAFGGVAQMIGELIGGLA